MSYEGTEEFLCQHGHYWTLDAMHVYFNNEILCPRCKEPFVWTHSIDETNGIIFDENGNPDPGTIGAPLEVSHYEEQVIQVPIYKVPQPK